MLRYPQGKYPPIKVTVSANESDVYFRVSDQGKGMDKERYECLWSYQSRARAGDFEDFKQVTTLPASIDGRASQASQMGHRHLGIGLTMSRIYAEYWGGELQILTMDGFGTDAYVRIPRLGTNIENLGIETHPVFQQSRPPLKRKKVSPKAKRSHELRLQSNPAAKKSHDLHHFDTSLTTAANSSNGWSQSHMIQS
jgi:hypothetical protein